MDSNQKLFTDQEIKDILDQDLLELMGAKDMPEEKKQELYQKMADTVQNRVIARIDDKLSDTEKQGWMGLVDQNDKAKMAEFLRLKNIDINKLLVEEALIYKTEIMSLSKQSKE